MSAATALIKAPVATPELAADAVRIALDKAGIAHPHAVLLYLSADFAHDPIPALRAAARAAKCLQIAGCTASGVFTEDEWVLDTPAAAVLVLGKLFRLQAACADAPVLTLAAPNALDWNWLVSGGERYGGVSGDASGQGPYSVWHMGRIQPHGRCELALTGGQVRIGVAHGVRPLSHPTPLTAVRAHDLLSIAGQPALSDLVRALPLGTRSPERMPLHLLMLGVIYGPIDEALQEGRYHLLPVLAANPKTGTVTVAGEVARGSHVFWAVRQPQAAEYEMRALIDRLSADRLDEPQFALMFPCMGRGPAFYNGEDKDIVQFTRRFPDTPLLGFYGNGEIAYLDGANRLLQHSTVLALFYPDVPA